MPSARQRLFGTRPLVIGVVVGSLVMAAACTKAHSSAAPSSSTPPVSSAPASSAYAVATSTSPSPSATHAVDPLTGLPATTAAAATRPALAVKIDNVLGAWPQSGLNQADIVFDLPVEAGLTRLMAVFHSNDVPLIGPVRSARPVDADLLRLFGHAYFAFSGGSKSDLAPIMSTSHATPMWWDVTPSLFMTRKDHAVPHQVFANTAMLYAGGQARTPSKTPPPAIFSYDATAPTGAAHASSVTAKYQSATATWNWDGSKYLRFQDGHPDVLMDGTQVSASNIVIMSVSIHDTAAVDSHGSPVPVPVVTGSGTAWVLRNGVMVKGIWSRANLDAPMKLVTSSGQIIKLTPGRTWVEVLPNPRQPQIS